MYQTAYNTTDGPLVADDFGRSIGGREWGTVDTTSEPVKNAVSSGVIHLFPVGITAEAGQTPAALEAQARTDVYVQRATVLHSAEKEALVQLALEHDLVQIETADDLPHKATLVGLLTPRVDIPVDDLAGTSVTGESETTEPDAEASEEPASSRPKRGNK